MADIITSYKNADAYGRAVFEQLDTYLQSVLLAGAEPALEPAIPVLMADSITLAQFSVVGINGAGRLVLATYNADPEVAIQAIGVLAHGATSGASNTTVRGQVWVTGVFNIDASSPLIWDATFDTNAKKANAFFGAPTPTRIIARNRLTPAA